LDYNQRPVLLIQIKKSTNKKSEAPHTTIAANMNFKSISNILIAKKHIYETVSYNVTVQLEKREISVYHNAPLPFAEPCSLFGWCYEHTFVNNHPMNIPFRCIWSRFPMRTRLNCEKVLANVLQCKMTTDTKGWQCSKGLARYNVISTYIALRRSLLQNSAI
jgi:hypothetical protein